MIAHLFESTLFLAAAILVTRIPGLAARTRYTIVFIGLMKFAIPSAIVPRLLLLAGIDLTRLPKGTIFIQALGTLAAKPDAGIKISYLPLVLTAIWLAVAAALLARALMLGRETLHLALANGRDADARELASLERARLRTGLSRSVRLISSSSIGAPATAGIVRPAIILPASTTLTSAELETILTHECVHIARHDNLLGLIESIAGSALWFHPLVWIARRILDAAREEACDAVVVISGDPAVYLTALRRVCGAAAGPRAAAVSCIVSNTIRERMEAIMTIGTRRLLNHRAVSATAVAVLALTTLGVGVVHALPSGGGATSKYKLDVTLTREASPDVFNFAVRVSDRQTGVEVSSANLRSAVDQWALATSELNAKQAGQHTAVIRAIGHADGTSLVEATVDHEPTMIVKIVAKRSDSPAKSSEGISIDLRDGDVRDVLKTFSQMTNTEIVVDDDVSGRVTLKMTDTPWMDVFEAIMHQNNLRYERTGNTIHVHRQ
jgi:beta-lactamase regulating signal transducer with metallopeptidase domain